MHEMNGSNGDALMDSNDENDNTDNIENRNNRPQGRRANVQRTRRSFIPLEQGDEELRILNRNQEIALSLLEQGLDQVLETKPHGMKLNRVYVAGMLLRIITPSKELSQANIMRRLKNQTSSSTPTVYRSIYLFLAVSERSPNQNRLFYMIMNSTNNTHLFERNTNFRDNGVISIGTLMLIVNPDPVENFLKGVPIITTKERAVVLQPMQLPEIPLKNSLDGNDSRGFAYNNAEITLEKTSFVESKCSGSFCDRQRIDEIKMCSMCGCFSTKANYSNVIPLWILSFLTSNGVNKVVKDFSSLQSFNLFTKGKMSIDVRARMLSSGSRQYELITDAMDNIVDFVNDNGGWSVYGWGKKGLINDATLIGVASDTKSKEENAKVAAEEVTTHIVHFHPTDRSLLDPDTDHGRKLYDMKFDLNTLC